MPADGSCRDVRKRDARTKPGTIFRVKYILALLIAGQQFTKPQ